jgi:hypothetical protein
VVDDRDDHPLTSPIVADLVVALAVAQHERSLRFGIDFGREALASASRAR